MKKRQAGSSLLELVIVIAVVLVISAVILRVINVAGQRSAAEQSKLDMFQEARQFMDQMSRDLRQAGYPSPRNMDPGVFTQVPFINDLHAAAGLVKVAAGDLWFEGDMDGDGKVSVTRYHLDTSTANGCPCLKRSQVLKVDGDPLTAQSETYQIEVQGVQNTNIFSAFTNGTAQALPLDITTSAGITIANVDTIQATLSLTAANIDTETRKKPVTTLVTTVRLNNCSQAAIGSKTSCQ